MAEVLKRVTVNAREGTVTYAPKRRKVALVGGGRTNRHLAPLGDPDWEVWSFNGMWSLCVRDGKFLADRWFELHPMFAQTPDEVEDMKRCPVPLYTLDYEPEVRCSVRYPLERVAAMGHGAFFSNSFSYAVALAILEGFEEVALYGLDLSVHREGLFERPSLEYWLGVASGCGLTITLPENSILTRHPYLYGYHYHEEADAVRDMLSAFVPTVFEDYERECRRELRLAGKYKQLCRPRAG